MEDAVCCPRCGHVISMHKEGGCYATNLACACSLDRAAVVAAIKHSAHGTDLATGSGAAELAEA